MIEVRKADGELDEIVARNASVHLERMDDRHWFLSITGPEGKSIALWFDMKQREPFMEYRND